MSRDLTTFPISQSVKFKLSNNGFLNLDDLKGFTPSGLAKEADLTAEEALDVLQIVFPTCNSKTSELIRCSAYDLLIEEQCKPPISTSSNAIDNILGGGIPQRKVTEICGCPGSGKTQFCLQICTNVQLPAIVGGSDGEALFIDTEGSFVIQRLVQIASVTVKDCKAKTNDSTLDSFNVENILKGIYYYPCKSYTEVIARINLLHEFLEQHNKVSLIVIDSISFHFRYGFDGTYSLRTRLLNGIMQILVKIAHDYKVAVVLTNQMTTKIDSNGSSYLVPALGESWGHSCTVRLLLSWTEEKRLAHILKSPSRPDATAHYTITKDGIRDIS